MSGPRTVQGVTLAESVTLYVRDDEVFIEFRDAGDRLFALAGLTLEAATQISERMTDACVEGLNHRRQAKAAARPKRGVLH